MTMTIEEILHEARKHHVRIAFRADEKALEIGVAALENPGIQFTNYYSSHAEFEYPEPDFPREIKFLTERVEMERLKET